MTDKPLSAVEKVKEESRGLRGPLADELAAGTDHFSDAGAQLVKFHGTYNRRIATSAARDAAPIASRLTSSWYGARSRVACSPARNTS